MLNVAVFVVRAMPVVVRTTVIVLSLVALTIFIALATLTVSTALAALALAVPTIT